MEEIQESLLLSKLFYFSLGLAKKTASLIEKETLKKRILLRINIEYRIMNIECRSNISCPS